MATLTETPTTVFTAPDVAPSPAEEHLAFIRDPGQRHGRADDDQQGSTPHHASY